MHSVGLQIICSAALQQDGFFKMDAQSSLLPSFFFFLFWKEHLGCCTDFKSKVKQELGPMPRETSSNKTWAK